MKKVLLVFLLIISFSFAKEDYSEMSTEELIAIMGYIKENNKKEFKKELQQRVPTMNSREKKFYERNLKKNQK
ncbi:MAG: DUF1104 domain-containing protein [Sulfurovum sp.]|jgi:hypothetical protein